MEKESPDAAAATDRQQVNVRLPRTLMGELMRYAGFEQALTGQRATQQELIERAVGELVASLRAKHGG